MILEAARRLVLEQPADFRIVSMDSMSSHQARADDMIRLVVNAHGSTEPEEWHASPPLVRKAMAWWRRLPKKGDRRHIVLYNWMKTAGRMTPV